MGEDGSKDEYLPEKAMRVGKDEGVAFATSIAIG